MGVERHVEEQRAAARGQRAGTGFDALPISAARLVEMNVGVNDAGKDVQAGGVDDFAEVL